MSAAMDIEKKLQTGVIAELRKRTYFATGGAGAAVSILHFMDNSSEERPVKYVVVHAAPAERLQPNSNFYKIALSVASLSHIPNDRTRSACETLYKECLDFVNRFDKSAVSTSAGLTVDGFVPPAGEENMNVNENYQIIVAKCDVYITQS